MCVCVCVYVGSLQDSAYLCVIQTAARSRAVFMLLALSSIAAYYVLRQDLHFRDVILPMASRSAKDTHIHGSTTSASRETTKQPSSNRSTTTSPVPQSSNTPGCHMANYDPFDPVAMKFTKLRPTLKCRNSEAWLTRVENGTIIVNETLLKVRNETLLECSYDAIIRVTDKLITYSEPEAFQTQIAIQPETEGVRVACLVRNSTSQVGSYCHCYLCHHNLTSSGRPHLSIDSTQYTSTNLEFF